MNLGNWLDARKMSRAAFAEQIRVHPVTVTKWITGKMMPRRQALRVIKEATGGQVDANDFAQQCATSPVQSDAA